MGGETLEWFLINFYVLETNFIQGIVFGVELWMRNLELELSCCAPIY
jgi:hypothetical protein